MSLTLKLMLSPLLIAQAIATPRRAPVLAEAAGPRAGRLAGRGRVMRMLIAGDSSAAGVGVARQAQSVAGHLTRSLQQRSGRPVHWTLQARSGLTTPTTRRDGSFLPIALTLERFIADELILIETRT